MGDRYENCTSISLDCPLEATIYGYYPSLPANAFFLAWFAALLVIQTVQGLYYKTWTFMIAMTLGCLTEAIGYVGRILLHHNPWSDAGFEMQICCLIIAPAFLSAGIYLTLKHIAIGFGEQWSLVRPSLYTYIFITCDFISLALQGAGGGLAASANGDAKQQDTGNDLMLTGICFQVVILAAFGSLATFYVYRTWNHHNNGEPLSQNSARYRNTTTFKLFVFGLILAFLTIFVRCIYRIPEMSGGWRNPLMQNERDFIAMDSAMIVVAAAALTIFHPGYCFPQMLPSAQSKSSNSRSFGFGKWRIGDRKGWSEKVVSDHSSNAEQV